MSRNDSEAISRRRALTVGAGVVGAAGLGLTGLAVRDRDASGTAAAYPEPVLGDPDRTYRLTASEAEINPGGADSYDGWAYDESYPGPEIRAIEGERVRVVVENDLPEATTIHWHGLPLEGDNAMDGVPGVTQDAIEPGEEFVYEFDATPAGTFWYHSHVGLQLDRELLGPLVIEERETHVDYDTEHTLVLDEFLPSEPRVATADGGMGGSFPAAPDAAGTLVNGSLPAEPTVVDVDEGDLIRLRLINAAAATTYAVGIDDHEVTVTHTDGPPVEPTTVDTLEIGMGERYDVIVEAASPGQWPIRIEPIDSGAPGGSAVLRYDGTGAVTGGMDALDRGSIGSRRLQYSDLRSLDPIPGVQGSPDHVVDLELSSGGMMSGMMDGNSSEPGNWTINGQAYPDADRISIDQGDHVRFRLRNRSPIRHPMHLHGHHFQVGDVVKDTVIVPPHMGQETIDFVAQNPGEWFFHCHHLYHMDTGMIRVVGYE